MCVCVLWMFFILVDWFLIMKDADSWQFHPCRSSIDCLSKQRPMFVLFENQMSLATWLALRTILLWGTCSHMLLFNVASMLDHYFLFTWNGNKQLNNCAGCYVMVTLRCRHQHPYLKHLRIYSSSFKNNSRSYIYIYCLHWATTVDGSEIR